MWTIKLGEGEKFVKIESQLQTASTVDHLHFTPTAFSGENIIYKHLDSNVFALITATEATIDGSADAIVYLVNGVSGRVLHRYSEAKVRLDKPLDIVLSEHIFVLAFQRQMPSGLAQ